MEEQARLREAAVAAVRADHPRHCPPGIAHHAGNVYLRTHAVCHIQRGPQHPLPGPLPRGIRARAGGVDEALIETAPYHQISKRWRIARVLLAAGVPMGPDGLITVRGRRSGLPRTTPVAIAEISGRRWVISPFGEVNWARNLRAARRATITLGRRKEEVTAVELGPAEAVEFIRDVLGPFVRQRRLAAWIVRNIDGIDVDNPVEAAAGRPIFELRPAGRPVDRSPGQEQPGR